MECRGALRTRFSYQEEETRTVVGGATTTGTVDGTTSTASGINSVLTNNGRQAFNLNADTELSELLSFSLTGSQVLTYDRSYNRRVSNTVFSAILQLRFFAGEIR